MNILNENEAIVINSLENWEKVAEILDKHEIIWQSENNIAKYNPCFSNEMTAPIYIYLSSRGIVYLHEIERKDDFIGGFTLIQDTEFIAKHSKNIFQEQMEAFYSQPLNQDKNMKIEVPKKSFKIRVLKENGLLPIGEIRYVRNHGGYLNILHGQDKDGMSMLEVHVDLMRNWLENGYIEEVKEVSYAFDDIADAFAKKEGYVATEKQAKQLIAFAKLTHVRAKILKDKNLENYDYLANTFYTIIADKEWQIRPIQSLSNEVYGLELRFPNRETAELALESNFELFKTYLGV